MGRRWAGLALVLAAAGCAGNPQLTGAQVRGTVRHGVEPLSGGTIRIVVKGDPSQSASGLIHGDGRYQVLNAPTGEVVVVIETESARWGPDEMLKLMASKGAEVQPEQFTRRPRVKYTPIDRAYSRADSSPLLTTVERGDNVRDFEVK